MKIESSETDFFFMNQMISRDINILDRTRFLILAKLFLFVSLNVLGQGSGCLNGPTVDLSFTSAGTCGLMPVTISGSFGGSATSITISENGNGSVSQTSISETPFEFTYTPKNKDNGKNVIITVTTNNPMGSPCTAAKISVTLTSNFRTYSSIDRHSH